MCGCWMQTSCSVAAFCGFIIIYIQCLNTVGPQITEKPDLSTHSRLQNSMMYSQKVTLQAGDALFIPEGWLHQVDSDEVTIAVNIWWRSSIMTSLPEHMDACYLRNILRRYQHGNGKQYLACPAFTFGFSLCMISNFSTDGFALLQTRCVNNIHDINCSSHHLSHDKMWLAITCDQNISIFPSLIYQRHFTMSNVYWNDCRTGSNVISNFN
ncbi:uncharacterized protein LOC113307808 isoform X1 [Papaver somniferum]|uniref:uncharacterized protein LOC113307808 isoform X1 n=1 Tax=Papaver somniferum TaxID=3469 RepID=UPI000E7026E9|nr:uncharacterized protein LOC113307808 isoform X1 [Papaver somniferum]